jgi:hypothetical protein
MGYILRFDAEILLGKPKYNKYVIKNGANEIPLETAIVDWDAFLGRSNKRTPALSKPPEQLK